MMCLWVHIKSHPTIVRPCVLLKCQAPARLSHMCSCACVEYICTLRVQKAYLHATHQMWGTSRADHLHDSCPTSGLLVNCKPLKGPHGECWVGKQNRSAKRLGPPEPATQN